MKQALQLPQIIIGIVNSFACRDFFASLKSSVLCAVPVVLFGRHDSLKHSKLFLMTFITTMSHNS